MAEPFTAAYGRACDLRLCVGTATVRWQYLAQK